MPTGIGTSSEFEGLTIADAIARNARYGGDRPAIICNGFPSFSYRELDQKIRQIAGGLSAAGIGASSRVGIVLPNGPEAAIVTVAVLAHAICFPIDPTLSDAGFAFELGRADLDAVVVPDWIEFSGEGSGPGTLDWHSPCNESQ